MTGLIDLTYAHDGRWYVLDYKSNRLPGYDAAHDGSRRWRTASTTCRR
jgi:ATP-dependent exoDNAse (exonuclease V) beta subunit